MQKLVICDYSTCEVHVFDVNDDIDINDTYISDIGFHPSNCTWMVGDNTVNLILHN